MPSASSIAIIDYDAGNLASVRRACAEVGVAAHITRDPDSLAGADRVIFPGVGAAGPAMASIRTSGMEEALKAFLASGRPLLGICLGMQISLDHSEEQGTDTLGLIAGRVQRFRFEDPSLKVPHMGWNRIHPQRAHPLLDEVEADDYFYFVHGYYPAPAHAEDVYAVARYEHDFACALGRDNYFGTQFHPEKSGRVGLRLLAAFARWDGTC
ncbi:MAG: imidazole glycerol phosphate synthase subunit HisH [Pseudomonadota bacterium]